MARSRSTKLLAQRADREYFKKPHPMRSSRRRLSIAAALGAIVAVVWGFAPTHRLVWSTGNVAPWHGFIEKDCAACHGPGHVDPAMLLAKAGATRSEDLVSPKGGASGHGAVTDTACSSCHRGSQHHANQVGTPSCSSCHAEHVESRAVSDGRCTSCHAALTTASGPPQVAAAITAFPDGHPEFRPLTRGPDPGRLRLNHDVHLWPGLQGPDGPSALTCVSCHVPDDVGRGFRAIRYDADCSRCHKLTVAGDKVLADALIPHGDFPRAEEFVKVAYERAGADQGAVAFAAARKKTCGRCHGVLAADDPRIEPVQLTTRWMPAARFDHRRHRELGCTACHATAETSRSTADVLLPGKAVCARCHTPRNGAISNCSTCHRYHPEESDKLGPAVLTLP